MYNIYVYTVYIIYYVTTFTHHKIRLEEEVHFSCLNLSSNCILVQLIQKYSETYQLYKHKINVYINIIAHIKIIY